LAITYYHKPPVITEFFTFKREQWHWFGFTARASISLFCEFTTTFVAYVEMLLAVSKN
jgi:hypothetical protein